MVKVTQWLGLSKTCVNTFGSVEAFVGMPGPPCMGSACILGDVVGLSLQKADSEVEIGVQEVR